MQVFKSMLLVLMVTILMVVALLTHAQAAEVDQEVDLRKAGVYLVDDVLYVRGNTTNYQASRVYELLRTNEVKRVVLSGNGGDLMAGLRIGRLIRAEGAVVQITSNTACVSACALAALGAKDGRIMLGGALLFHRGYIPKVPIMVTLDQLAQVNQYIAVVTTQYLLKMGYSADFALRLAYETSPCSFMLFQSTSAMRKLYYGVPELDAPKTKGYTIYDVCEAGR